MEIRSRCVVTDIESIASAISGSTNDLEFVGRETTTLIDELDWKKRHRLYHPQKHRRKPHEALTRARRAMYNIFPPPYRLRKCLCKVR